VGSSTAHITSTYSLPKMLPDRALGLGLVGLFTAFFGTALVVGSFWAQTFGARTLGKTALQILNQVLGGGLEGGFFMSSTLSGLPSRLVMSCHYLDGVLQIQQKPSGFVSCSPAMVAKK
jgi:hypothetical protein